MCEGSKGFWSHGNVTIEHIFKQNVVTSGRRQFLSLLDLTLLEPHYVLVNEKGENTTPYSRNKFALSCQAFRKNSFLTSVEESHYYLILIH